VQINNLLKSKRNSRRRKRMRQRRRQSSQRLLEKERVRREVKEYVVLKVNKNAQN